MSISIAAFSGSLRKDSYNTKLIKAFEQLAPEGVIIQTIDIGKLPLLNQDLETDLPQTVKDLHNSLDNADAILFATPEYNRSYSPVLKNALDWGSRPQGQNRWNKKPAIVVGCTPSALGTFGAQNHLRQVLTYLNIYTLQQPEFYLGHAADKFNDKGELTDEQTKKKITQVWTAFIEWINKIK